LHLPVALAPLNWSNSKNTQVRFPQRPQSLTAHIFSRDFPLNLLGGVAGQDDTKRTGKIIRFSPWLKFASMPPRLADHQSLSLKTSFPATTLTTEKEPVILAELQSTSRASDAVTVPSSVTLKLE
jgi:hypothetical protein